MVLLNLFSIGILKVLCFQGFLDTRSPKGEGNKWCSLPLHRKKQVRERYKQGGRFLEFARVHGNVYGTGIEGVESVDEGKVRLLQFLIQISER
jgi:hypothetical protein